MLNIDDAIKSIKLKLITMTAEEREEFCKKYGLDFISDTPIEHSCILKMTDATLLNPCASYEQIAELCTSAEKYDMASVCIPPKYIRVVCAKYNIPVCTVVGFPFGYENISTKEYAARLALYQGASEIDWVIDQANVVNRNWRLLAYELQTARFAVPESNILKIIIETANLSDEDIAQVSKMVADSGANYVKTSTGYASRGATVHDIEIIKANIPKEMGIKASGGISTFEKAEEMIKAGATRIGSSKLHLITETN